MKSLKFTLVFLFSIVLSGVSAQSDSDSLFELAISKAKIQQFDQSLVNAKLALKAAPERGDVHVFIANMFSWQNQNDSALVYLEKAKSLNYRGDDYFESYMNVLLRTEQYENLLKVCNQAEQSKYANTEDLFRKKLIAYTELKYYDSGVRYAELPENKIYLNEEPFSSLYTNLLLKRNTRVVSATYQLDLVDNLSPQHLASLGYSFKMSDHTWVFRINYANRYGLTDVQTETDFYLQMKKSQYLYMNYGYAYGTSLFPRHRLGLEYYFPLFPKTEASIGGRYMNYVSSDIVIATGHLGQYLGKSWIAIRPFYVYTLNTQKQSLSFIANYRLYGKNELSYWGLELGFGNSPDDIYSTTQTGGFNQLEAYKVKLEKNFMLNRVSDFRIGLGYSYEEFIVNQFRNRVSVELGYKLRLK